VVASKVANFCRHLRRHRGFAGPDFHADDEAAPYIGLAGASVGPRVET
jgi:hypothetical protein